jgi:positive regulator of sigma E activity
MKKVLIIIIAMFISSCASKATYNPPIDSENVSKVHLIRPTDPLTLTQGVEIDINDKYLDKLWHASELVTYIKHGKNKITTSVGLSLGVPNVTGFNGAKKFTKIFTFDKPSHYFKVEFNPGLLAGQHVIIEITEEQFKNLAQ